jgi:hypothetical protein
MTVSALKKAARQLAVELRIPPQLGGVWTWVEDGSEKILVELRRDAGVTVPASFHGYNVVVRDQLNPTARGIHNDL